MPGAGRGTRAIQSADVRAVDRIRTFPYKTSLYPGYSPDRDALFAFDFFFSLLRMSSSRLPDGLREGIP